MLPFLILMEELQKLVFYNCKQDKEISVFHICIFVSLDYFIFKGLFNKKNWINEREPSAVTFGYLCSIFAILGRVHPNQFCSSAPVPIVLQDYFKSWATNKNRPYQETVILCTECDLWSWVLSSPHLRQKSFVTTLYVLSFLGSVHSS